MLLAVARVGLLIRRSLVRSQLGEPTNQCVSYPATQQKTAEYSPLVNIALAACVAICLFMTKAAISATPADILSNQLIQAAWWQATQDSSTVDVPFAGDSLIHRMRVQNVLEDAVNRGSSGARGTNVCQMVRQVPEFQTRRAALIHVGVNDAQDILFRKLITVKHWRNRVSCILAYATIPLVWTGIHYTAWPDLNLLIDEMNTIAKEACEARELPCVWVRSPWTQFNQSDFFDEVHLNAQGYSVWIPAIREGFADLGIAP